MIEAKATAQTTISATVIRADGTKEELGTVSKRKFLLSDLFKKIKKEIKNGNSTHHSR